jgi:hypothetical protein
MSIGDVQRFAALPRMGSSSVIDRLDLLAGHRGGVQRHIADLQGDHKPSTTRSLVPRTCSMSRPERASGDHR